MAEVLGVVASAFSVASLAVQLGDSLQKAYEFWESIEDGPEDIRRISTELRLLANFLRMIQYEQTSGAMDPAQEELVRSALQIAKQDIDELAVTISELARAVGPNQKRLRQKWGRVRIVLKESKIAKMRGYIEGAKSILNLLQASRTQSTILRMNGKLDMMNATMMTRKSSEINEAPVEPPVQRSSNLNGNTALGDKFNAYNQNCGRKIQTTTTLKTIEAGVGVLTLSSTSAKMVERNQDDEEQRPNILTRTTFVVIFVWRFASCRRGLRIGVNDSFDSWSFNSIRRRPDDSSIFSLSRVGDTEGVLNLLKFGKASVFDVDTAGATPLHYACRYGRSNLVQLLVDRGSDVYLRNDEGHAPMDDLEEHDRRAFLQNRQEIAKIVDIMIHCASFDPFEWTDASNNFESFTLWNGLPYENLVYLLTQESFYVEPTRRFDLILSNLLQLHDSVTNYVDCVNLLLSAYESLRSSTNDQWGYNFTLLQHLVVHWLDDSEGHGRGPGLKIARALKLTADLWRCDKEGTALDIVARYDAKRISEWLGFLSNNGVNIRDYGRYEEAQHPQNVIYQGPDACCRIVTVHFHFADSKNSLTIEIDNVCDPHFEYLHPEYRCGVSRRRELCISHLDEVFIGVDGKPITSVPGSWTTTLKPNSQLPIALRFYEHGWQYMDFLEPNDHIWEEGELDAELQEASELHWISHFDEEAVEVASIAAERPPSGNPLCKIEGGENEVHQTLHHLDAAVCPERAMPCLEDDKASQSSHLSQGCYIPSIKTCLINIDKKVPCLKMAYQVSEDT